MQNKFYSTLGLASRAKCATSGEFSVEKAIKAGTACMVIIAGDASENTKKHFSDMCSYRNIPKYEYGDKESLGHALGKQVRAVVAITQKGFAESLVKNMEASN